MSDDNWTKCPKCGNDFREDYEGTLHQSVTKIDAEKAQIEWLDAELSEMVKAYESGMAVKGSIPKLNAFLAYMRDMNGPSRESLIAERDEWKNKYLMKLSEPRK